jgi:hypothetical protein
MSLIARIWPWSTVIAGVLIIALTYADAADVGIWFDDHGQPDNISAVPEIGLGIVGLLLIGGGILAGLRGRRV